MSPFARQEVVDSIFTEALKDWGITGHQATALRGSRAVEHLNYTTQRASCKLPVVGYTSTNPNLLNLLRDPSLISSDRQITKDLLIDIQNALRGQ